MFSDVIVPNFVTNTHNDLNSNNILHRLMVKMKQVFNIRRSVDFRENALRKNFNNWLHLVSDKILSKTYFDGDLIILIEGVNLLVEQDHDCEINLKFWLPRELPPRVKILLTLEEDSYNIAYLKKLGCKFLTLCHQVPMKKQLIQTLSKRVFYTPGEFAQKVFGSLGRKLEGDKIVTSGFIKSNG